jgi:hypothetical protein
MRLVGLSGLLTAAAWAGPPLIHQDFAQDASGWMSFGPSPATIKAIHDPLTVRNGKGALSVEYEGSAAKPAILALPVPHGLAGMKSLRAGLMVDSPTAAAIFLSEKEGGRYSAVVWLEPHVWEQVELTPDDFILGTSPADPKDPDGKLDLDQINAVGILDLSQVFPGMFGDTNAPLAIDLHSGKHKLLMDDFEIGTDSPSWYKPRTALEIDRFVHPSLLWFTLGGADLKLDTDGKVIPGNSLEATYQQSAERFVVIPHELPPMDLSKATHLAFDIASEKPSTIIFAFEEVAPGKERGPRYSANVEVDGGGKPAHREVALSSFALDQNGAPDPGGKLDRTKLKSISLVDITAAITGQEAVNTIHLANLQAITKSKAQ